MNFIVNTDKRAWVSMRSERDMLKHELSLNTGVPRICPPRALFRFTRQASVPFGLFLQLWCTPCAQFSSNLFSSNLFLSNFFRPILFLSNPVFVQFTFVHDLYSSNLFSSNFSPFPFFVQKKKCIMIKINIISWNIQSKKNNNSPKVFDLERFLF